MSYTNEADWELAADIEARAELEESAQHNHQHSNGTEPQGEICADCRKPVAVLVICADDKPRCIPCLDKRKLRHC